MDARHSGPSAGGERGDALPGETRVAVPATLVSAPARRVLAVALAAATVAVAAGGARLVCAGGGCAVPAVDAAGLAVLRGWHGPVLDLAFGAITWAGSIAVLGPAALWVAWRDRSAIPRRAAWFVPIALLGATVIAQVVKWVVARPRPELDAAIVAMPADASFPSAHAMQATAFAAAVLLRPGWRSGGHSGGRPGWRALAIAATFVALVALSRVYLQVHFPTDVAFGVVMGVLWVGALRCLPEWRGSGR